MSSIAYITDSKMLEMHRLNGNKTMNFWRLSKKINFSDFKEGDLVFFLSKDKAHQRKKEKGIVGYGRVKEIHLSSIKSMWKKYNSLNGFNTYEEFYEALLKINKNKKLPDKISSFYLENVSFFQGPIYLSECDMHISNNVESYIYLKPDDVPIKILEYAKDSLDLWANLEDNTSSIENDIKRLKISRAYKNIGEYKLSDKLNRRAYRELRKFKKDNDYEFIADSKQEMYQINDKDIEILLYNDKEVDKRLLIGQTQLYLNQLKDENIVFKLLNDDKDLLSLLNKNHNNKED